MTTAATRPAPPPPRTRNEHPALRKASPSRVTFGEISGAAGHRIVLFGPGGVGKSTLAATARGPVAFFDLDDSLPILRPSLGKLDVRLVGGVTAWQNVRDALHAPGWDGIRTVVIDSATRAEELATEWVIANVPHDQNKRIERIEDFGFGKGYTHIYETFLKLLGDLNAHARAGRHVILICHDCTSTVPNPQGEDWIRYEPRLQSPSSGKNSVRLRVREWADHVLFYGYDINVEDGKADSRSCQTRTVYPTEQPHCMAKSRTLRDPVPVGLFDVTLWDLLFGKE